MLHPKDISRVTRANTRRASVRVTQTRLDAARVRRTALRRGLAPRLVTLALVGALVAACGGQPGVSGELEGSPVDPATSGLDEPSQAAGTEGAEGQGTEGAGAHGTEADAAPDDAASATPAAAGPLELRFDEHELIVEAADGSTTYAWGLPASGLETFTDVLVRPGASDDRLDAVVATYRGEVIVLYHLAVRDGTEGTLTELPSHLQPQDELEAVITLAWTPDAGSVLWTELAGARAVLRSVGWDEGPGTGRPADDNATFDLDLPADVMIDGFRVEGEDTWTLLLTDGVGQDHELPMERQADGALALR